MKRLFTFLAFFAILLSGCSFSKNKTYTVGIDPSFSPAVLGGQADNVYGFTVDVLQAIAKIEGVNLKYSQAGSENLFSGLRLGGFQGILSTLYPLNQETETYSVSNTYFKTGPVLVVPYDSNLTSLEQFNSKIVGVLVNSDAFYIVQKYPYIVISTFVNPAFLMEGLSYGESDGIVLSLLEAQSFVNNLYNRVLKIASPPLNNEGLRMITIVNQNEDLIKLFNRGLEECKKRGIYQNLLQKWKLN
ncbi:MAG: putative histidine-binding protein [Chlamydiae bacterium]|nr:putative histidine-binding protein [Chlamydiota bacterium]